MSGPLKQPAGPSSEHDERLTRLYEDTSRDLLAFLLRRCPTAEDAADCLAEAYRIAWEKHTRIPPGGEARPWLFGVARNVIRRARTSDERAAASVRELALAAERSSAIRRQEDSAVTAALCELSELDRELLTMLSMDGLAPREVASVLGLSPNAVRVRAHRAREKLRTLLAPDDSAEQAEVAVAAVVPVRPANASEMP